MLLRFMFAPTRRFFCFDGNEPGPGPNPPPNPNPPVPPNPPQPPAPPVPPVPSGETAEQRVARLERSLADTRAEAAAYRIDARTQAERTAALNVELEQARAATNTAVDQVRTNADSQVQAERALRLDAELKAAAVSAGLIDADLLPLIDRRNVRVDATTGQVTGLVEAIAAFRTSKPAYFRDGAPNPAPPVPPTNTGLRNAPPPPGPGAAPPSTSVLTLPKTAEGKASYEAQKRAGLQALRAAGG